MDIEKYLEADVLRHVIADCEDIRSAIEDNTHLIDIMRLLRKDDNIKVRFLAWLDNEEKIAEYRFKTL